MLHSIKKLFNKLKGQPKPLSDWPEPARTAEQDANMVLWIEALLSGEYKQGRGQLYHEITDCYCVLGVAAESFGFVRVGETYFFGCHGTTEARSSKEAVPVKWFADTYGLPYTQIYYTGLNDLGESFAAIASRLANYLPDSCDKAELRYRIAEKLRDEARCLETA